jgi:hypothetical protein
MGAEQALRVRPNRPRLEQLTLTSSTLRLAVPKQTLQLGWVVTVVREAQSLPRVRLASCAVAPLSQASTIATSRNDPLARARLRRITTRSLTCASREIRSVRPAEHFVLAFNGILT